MKLFHFTYKKNLKQISPAFFGKNSYTNNDGRISSVKRAFYYNRPSVQEHLLTDCPYRYTVDVDKKKIYDLTSDKKNFLVKHEGIHGALIEIKKHYIGITYDCGFQCYCLFKPLKVKEIKKLWNDFTKRYIFLIQ